MLNQKGVAHIFFILVLLVGIIVTVFLAGKTQIFKPKASVKNIEFSASAGKDDKGNVCTIKVNTDGNPETNCFTVKIKFTSPIDTSAVSDAGFSLAKEAYAAESKGGVGYSCEKEGGDKLKIYHQKCNFQFLGINFCELNLPGSKYELIQEDCDFGTECESTTTDLFNTVAKCTPASIQQSPRIFQPPVVVQQPIPTPTFASTPRTIATPIPTPIPVATTAPRATVTPTPIPTVTTTATPTPAAAVTATSTPTPTPTPTTTSAGVGTTEPPAKVTMYFRFVLNPTDFKDALCIDTDTYGCWQTYTQKGSTISYTFNTLGQKFIFAEFKDNLGTIYKSNPLSAEIGIVAATDKLAADKTAADAKAAADKLAADKAAADKTAASAKVASDAKAAADKAAADQAAADSATCDIQVNIGNWRSCTKDGLKKALEDLPPEKRNLIENAALFIYPNDVLLQLFSKERLALLPTSYLRNFGNGDLLAIADASGKDRKTFLSGFSCDRLISFSQDITDLFKVECGF